MKDIIKESMERSKNELGPAFQFFVLPLTPDASGEVFIPNAQREPAWNMLIYELQQFGFTAEHFSEKLNAVFGSSNQLEVLQEIARRVEAGNLPAFYDVFKRYPEFKQNYSKLSDGTYFFAVGDPEYFYLRGLLNTATDVRRENEQETTRKHEFRLGLLNTIVAALITATTTILIAIPSCINNEYEGLEKAIGDTNSKLVDLQRVIQDKQVAGEVEISNDVLSVELEQDNPQQVNHSGAN
ncbi:MAG: hypothetical protein H7A35_15500 [Planctomycetales bacterium]|nr:MAG: hypothetical protein H7A35_15500 [Planctomycetales bacterium]